MRNKIMRFRVATAEADTIRQRAEKAGKTVSEYLRTSAINLYIHAPIPAEVTRSISRWSANLNQLAYRANSTGEIEAEEIRALRQEAISILQALEVKR